MKFIHLTDTHVIGEGELYGQDPAARLRAAVASINAKHGDADFVVLTGDMTHWGDAAAYTRFSREIKKLNMPVHLMVGNHDDTAAFGAAFPETPRDDTGFVQCGFDTLFGRFLLLDTKDPEAHAGAYCPARQAWLGSELDKTNDPIVLFMHHPPFKTGITSMDRIMLQDAETFYDVIAPHKARIRHLFFGHVHRAIFGNWRGMSYSCMRGLNHQVALELNGAGARIAANFEPPAYGVVLLSDDQITVHLHDFADRSERFFL